jgi:ATP-dependent Clp protease ATP-binding subunit ClpX
MLPNLTNLIKSKETLSMETPESTSPSTARAKFTPSAIVRYLDQFVIGQEDAKNALAVVVYGHYKNRAAAQDHADAMMLGKSNVLLVGPTGSGKTLLCETLSRAVNVPFATADATSLTQSKFVGEEIVTILRRLVTKADGDIAKAERGIIFVDEIDKLKAAGAESNSASGASVQHALLKIMEGAPVNLGNGEMIDTTHILFICGGAFVGLDALMSRSQSFGFISLTEGNNQAILDRLNSRVKPTDLISFGLIPEFTGRLPVVANLQALDKAMLARVMTEPTNCLYNQFRALLAREGVTLEIAPRVFDEIAALAVEYQVGARSLRGIFEEMIRPVLFAIPDMPTVKNVSIRSLFAEAVLTKT